MHAKFNFKAAIRTRPSFANSQPLFSRFGDVAVVGARRIAVPLGPNDREGASQLAANSTRDVFSSSVRKAEQFSSARGMARVWMKTGGGIDFLAQLFDAHLKGIGYGKSPKFGAEEGTRTPTAFRPPAPKAGASANSATSALPDSITDGRCEVGWDEFQPLLWICAMRDLNQPAEARLEAPMSRSSALVPEVCRHPWRTKRKAWAR